MKGSFELCRIRRRKRRLEDRATFREPGRSGKRHEPVIPSPKQDVLVRTRDVHRARAPDSKSNKPNTGGSGPDVRHSIRCIIYEYLLRSIVWHDCTQHESPSHIGSSLQSTGRISSWRRRTGPVAAAVADHAFHSRRAMGIGARRAGMAPKNSYSSTLRTSGGSLADSAGG